MSIDRRISCGVRGEARGATHFIRHGRGVPIVLIHGVGMSAEFWAPQVEALSRDYDVVAYDMLGHGNSSLPPDDARLQDYTEQLLALMDALSIQKAHVIGHSMGGLIAIDFALSHPSRVLSIATLNTVYCRTAEQAESVRSRSEALERADLRETVKATIARWFGNPIAPELHGTATEVESRLLSVDPIGYRRSYRVFAYSDEAHKGRLASLSVPSLFMTGEFDPNSTPEMSRQMAVASRIGRYEILRNARHMMSLTAPDEVNAHLRRFVSAADKYMSRAAEKIDPKSFRQALGTFVTGVTVVATIQENGEPRGFTANSFSSVSLDPPLVLVCIAKTAASYETFATTDRFAVSVLAENQKDISSLFASKSPDKFARIDWKSGLTGSPIIQGAVSSFDCRVWNKFDAGDHAVLVGEVVDFEFSNVSPLGYGRGAYLSFSLSQSAVAANTHRTRVGAILEHDGSVLLVEGTDGKLDLPAGRSLGPESDSASLKGMLTRLGIIASINFLFAVYEYQDRSGSVSCIYYRGTLDGSVPGMARASAYPFDKIPWERIGDAGVRAMLERYVRERSEDGFGVYVGDADQGTIKVLAVQRQPEAVQNGVRCG